MKYLKSRNTWASIVFLILMVFVVRLYWPMVFPDRPPIQPQHPMQMVVNDTPRKIQSPKKKVEQPTDTPSTEAPAPKITLEDRWFRELASRDVKVREDAVRRFISTPEAAPEVVEAFSSEVLQIRLAAFDVLQAWGAPLDELSDPWNVENVPAKAWEKLRKWAEKGEIKVPTKLEADQRTEIGAEIDRMLNGDSLAAEQVRERLARFGAAVLPEVQVRQARADTDQAKQRLLALRYRLAADDSLALKWDGLERLASNHQEVRHQALKELDSFATRREESLLLELFSDTDPFIRELSLRILHRATGKRATSALVKLLDDPDANVRAAVLKQLIDNPNGLTPNDIDNYLRREKDVDLLVYAIRVLHAMNVPDAALPLFDMLDHSAWQVRAEAAETIGVLGLKNGNLIGTLRGRGANLLFRESEPFVVAKMLKATAGANDLPTLNDVAGRHPDLIDEIISQVVHMTSHQDKQISLDALRNYFERDREDFRVAAIKAIGNLPYHNYSDRPKFTFDDIRGFVFSGLKDSSVLVRTETLRQVHQIISRSGEWSAPADSGDQAKPGWIKELEPKVQESLRSKEVKESITAAQIWVLLGYEKEGFPVLLDYARRDGSILPYAANHLKWVAKPNRLARFEQILALATDSQALGGVLHSITSLNDDSFEERLWKLADEREMNHTLLFELFDAINSLYSPMQDPWFSSFTVPRQNDNRKDPTGKLGKGSETVQLLAMMLSAKQGRPEALPTAQKMAADTAFSIHARTVALHIELMALAKKQRQVRALALLDHAEANFRHAALFALDEHRASNYLSDFTRVGLNIKRTHSYYGSHEYAKIPVLPPGLSADKIRPFLKSKSAEVSTFAAFLLVALKDQSAWIPLFSRWNSAPASEKHTNVDLVYSAIALLNRDDLVSILEDIWEDRETYHLQNYPQPFYWTIRAMDGPRALALRKRIRTEAGDKLSNN